MDDRESLFNESAETATLGGVMLLGERGLDMVSDIICADDFYLQKNVAVFASLARCCNNNMVLDPIAVCDDLQARDELKLVGSDYVSALAMDTPSAANVLAYAKIVKEHSMARRLIAGSTEVITMCYKEPDMALEEKLEKAQQIILHAADASRAPNPMKGADQIVSDTIDTIEARSEKGDGMVGVSSGFADLDLKLSGLPKQDLIILAGRPSMGKTAVAVNLVENVAKQGEMCVLFSLEMPADSLMIRMISSLSDVPVGRVRSGNLSTAEWSRVGEAKGVIQNLSVFIDDTSGITPNHVRARTRRLIREQRKEAGLIVIDYVQLMRSSVKASSREGEVSEISRSLKEIAKEFDCPVIALSQLNRGVENRPVDQRRPRNADLRESGSLEQDADTILFIYRDVVYNSSTRNPNIAELIISKQRNGELGTVHLVSELQYQRFKTCAQNSLNLDEPEITQDDLDYKEQRYDHEK